MPSPSDERERLILSFLSHGKKQRIEIIEFLQSFEDVSEDAVDNKLKRLDDYGEVEKEEREDGTFYRRPDIDQIPSEVVRPKRVAERGDIDRKLSDLEQRLGIGSEIKKGPTDPPKTSIELLQSLLNDAMNYDGILYDDPTLERHLTIFDEYISKLKYAYIDNRVSKARMENSTPEVEFRLFLHLTRELNSNSKRGQEHSELRPELSHRLVAVEEILSHLPVGLGIECLGLAREIHCERGKDFYQQIILLDKYPDKVLEREAFYTYDIHNEIDELISDLSKISDDPEHEKSQKIRNLIDSITTKMANGKYMNSNI